MDDTTFDSLVNSNRTASLPAASKDAQGPHIYETFGFAGLSFGIFFLIASVGALLPTDTKNAGSNSVFAISSGTLAAVLLIKEIRRRRQRAVLVLDGGRLGLYRQGKLFTSVPLVHVAIDHVERLFRRIMLAIFLSIVAIVAFAVALTERDVTTTASTSFKVAILSLAVLGASTIGSLVWTWFGCHRVLFTGDARESLMLIRPKYGEQPLCSFSRYVELRTHHSSLPWRRKATRIGCELERATWSCPNVDQRQNQ